MKEIARDVFLVAFDFDSKRDPCYFQRMVKRSKKGFSIWETGHGWALLLPRTCTWKDVVAMLEQLRSDG